MKSGSQPQSLAKREGEDKKSKPEGQGFHNPFLHNSATFANNPFGGGGAKSDTTAGSALQMKKNPFLPTEVQTKMENSFGTDFSNVKIQTNSSKASQIGAHAFAQGNEVHFAQGKFDPNSKQGQSLIGHELAHVVQQRNGQVKPDVQMKGLGINTDSGLEAQADKQGQAAAEGKAAQTKAATSSYTPSNAPVQGFFGSLVKKGLNFLKSKVVEMIPEDIKNMVPPEIREMASNLADQGIEAAGGLADKGGQALMQKAKTKLATIVPPKLMQMVDNMPPELRTYLEGVLKKGGQLAENALSEGRLPTGDELKSFGKGAASGGVDVARELIPKAIPPEAKALIDKLPPEVKALGERQFNKGMDTLKGGIESGEMPDIKTFAEEAISDGADTGKELATKLAGTVLEDAPAKVQSAIESLPDDVKNFLMNKLASAS